MNLPRLADLLFRERSALYARIADGRELGKLLRELILLFFVSAGFYGCAMGSFRLFHPEFIFSDFEITAPNKEVVRGKIEGIKPEAVQVFTSIDAAELPSQGEIRFNVTFPSEPVSLVSVQQEKGYRVITLPPGTVLEEADAWHIPFLVALKTPLLFVLTLLVCAPALYVLNLCFNMGLRFMPLMALMSLALAATGALLGVFVPIAALFSFVTENYHFMKVFHVCVFAAAGFFGVRVLGEGLSRLAPEGAGFKGLLRTWLLVYCLVGGQVAWTLKPFLGTPYLPATPPFRIEAGNIYVSFFKSLGQVSK